MGARDVGSFDRDDAGTVGVVAAGCEASDATAVHASARGAVGGEFPRQVCLAKSGARPAGCGREAAGDPGPWRQQAILGRGRWDADALRDIVRDYALETLADDDAVLVIDETGFLKQGKASCGVARQYTGSAGKITNCQIGVFACYVAPRGHAFIDRELYLPKSWTDDPARMAKAHVPQEIIDSASGGFATKPAMARAMIERAIAAKVPFSFVAADSVYGVGDIEMALRRAGKGYVLGVKSNQPFHSWGKPRQVAGTAKDIADALPASAWRRLSAGAGTKGERVARLGLSRTRRSRWRRIQRGARRARMDARTSDPAQNHRRRPRLLHHMGADAERRSKDWRKSKDIAGRSKTVSKRRRMNSASITTRRAPGMAGVVTCRWSCSPSP